MQIDPIFTLQSLVLRGLEDEFAVLGISSEVAVKEKARQPAIASAFLKAVTAIVKLVISNNRILHKQARGGYGSRTGIGNRRATVAAALFVRCEIFPPARSVCRHDSSCADSIVEATAKAEIDST